MFGQNVVQGSSDDRTMHTDKRKGRGKLLLFYFTVSNLP